MRQRRRHDIGVLYHQLSMVEKHLHCQSELHSTKAKNGLEYPYRLDEHNI